MPDTLRRREFLGLAAAGLLTARSGRAQAAPPPNIVFILADDLGYGDVSCLNPESKIPTPHLDRLASQGIRCLDAHSASGVCTPTRYGILTGRYPWRSELKNGVLMGWSPRLIEPGRLTVAALLKQHGYRTGCFGKWHLGLGWPSKQGRERASGWNVDYARPFTDGPLALGFDDYFGISASLDMPPFCYLEGDRVTEQPTVEKKWLRNGPAAQGFEAIDVLPTVTDRAVKWLGERPAGQPFFLYLPLTSPHTPVVPTADVKDKSRAGAYGDFVVETDQAVGRVLAKLDERGLSGNTLVIFTSDNGCSPAGLSLAEQERYHHAPSYHFRGMKADAWDGGHRIPCIARWPGHIAAGSITEETLCLNDLLATAAGLVGAKLPDNAGEDSYDILPALTGAKLAAPIREATIHASIEGRLAIRQGRWKLVMCPGSGGWGKPTDKQARDQQLPPVQLYDMVADVGEQHNLQAEQPEVVERLKALLTRIVKQGRSTPGLPQRNSDDWWPQLSWLPKPKGLPSAPRRDLDVAVIQD